MIKNNVQMQNVLKSYDSKGWIKSAELGQSFDISDSPKVPGGKDSFGELLTKSIAKVNDLQNEANVAVEKLASGESKNLHETLLAVEKADIAFRTMNQVRTKVIDAYKEIMKMQV